MHRSVGAIIKNANNEILLLDRVNYPLGWACPAGHVDKRETPKQALLRETKEETNLDVLEYKLLFHEFVEWNECSAKVMGHDWSLFEVIKWSGDLIKNDRAASKLLWAKPQNFKDYDLEPVWEYWFKKLKVI